MTELEQWKHDLFSYTEEYEKVALQIKERSNHGYGLISEYKPLDASQVEKLKDVGVALSTQLQRLVELRSEAFYNYRALKNFYERTVIERKLAIMGSGEKKIAAGVAENQATLESFAEFDLMNEAERYADTSDKRWEATVKLIDSLRTKLNYGSTP